MYLYSLSILDHSILFAIRSINPSIQKAMSHSLTPLQATQHWFDTVVLGLNLCPFAHRPARKKQIHFAVSEAVDEDSLMTHLLDEIRELEQCNATQRETTLVITPRLLKDFYDYQFFLSEAQRQLKNHGWVGVFQLASFHPEYCFAGSQPEDLSNLTNRAPFPIIHILREESLTEILENVDNSDEIPANNIVRINKLSTEEREALFFYLENKD